MAQPIKTRIIGAGTYKAGFDFAPGDIGLKHLTKDLADPIIPERTITCFHPVECFVGSAPTRKGSKKICSFQDSCHLEMAYGEYIIIKCDACHSNLIQIELTEYN